MGNKQTGLSCRLRLKETKEICKLNTTRDLWVDPVRTVENSQKDITGESG